MHLGNLIVAISRKFLTNLASSHGGARSLEGDGLAVPVACPGEEQFIHISADITGYW
jgi:hypothetical protein